jgi:hypothetical protein
MVIYENEPFTEVVRRFCMYPKLRTTFIVSRGGVVRGISTRGDVMRLMQRCDDAPFTKSAIELCNANPKVVFDTFDTEPSTMAEIVDYQGIGLCDIPVVGSESNILLGFVGMQDKYEAFANYFKLDAETGRLKQIPTIVFSELPKSAGTYITMTIAKNLGIVHGGLSHVYFSSDLSRTVYSNKVLHAHYSPEKFFADRLGLFFPKLIVHIRDLRAVILSHIHQFDRMKNSEPFNVATHVLQYNEGWDKKSFDEKLSSMLDVGVNSYTRQVYFYGAISYIDFLRQVIDVKKAGRSDVLFTTFEEFVRDNDAFFKKILDFYEIPRTYWKGREIKKTSATLFRKGSVDEWRTAFTREQIDRINAKIPDEFFDAFGWER